MTITNEDLNLAQEIVERLNRLCEDPAVLLALDRLCRSAVMCGSRLQEHPTVQVWRPREKGNPESSGYAVGFLGMLNGVVGVIPNGKRSGWGYIAAVLEANGGPLVRFELTEHE